jgi:hypothetical protein
MYHLLVTMTVFVQNYLKHICYDNLFKTFEKDIQCIIYLTLS